MCLRMRLRSLKLIPGVVGAAHQWAALDMPESHLPSDARVLAELVRGDVAFDGEVFFGRAKVLPDGDDIYLPHAQIAQQVDDLVACLAKAEHEAGLGGRLGTHLFGPG